MHYLVMKKISKRLSNQIEQIEKTKLYEPLEALTLLKKITNTKFNETIEAHISLNIDPKYNDQQLRASLILPQGTGKSIRLAVVTSENDLEIARKAGADVYGSDDLINQILQEEINFDVLIATPEQMPKLAKLGKILGPKGLMPSPKSGTVTKNIPETLNEFKKGKLEYRADKTGIVHIPFGKVDFSVQNLYENLQALFQSIERNKPTGVRGRYFNSFYICTTMSPSVQIGLNYFK